MSEIKKYIETTEPVEEKFGENFECDGLTVDLVRKYTEIYLLSKRLNEEDLRREMFRRAVFLEEKSGYGRLTKETLEYYQMGQGRLFLEHRHSLYLDSSDNLESLTRVNVAGKKVLTVAASGEFAEIFINGGARAIELFDVSIPGVLFNELKIICLRRLPFEQFKQMFVERKDDKKWFDPEIYQEVRPFLSQQSQIFFDAISESFKENNSLTKDRNFARSRKGLVGAERKTSFVGDFLDEDSYLQLQEKARRVSVKISWCSVTRFLANGLKDKDFVYLSNIGYQPDITMTFAACCLRRGAKEVLFSLGHRRIGFRQPEKTPDELIATLPRSFDFFEGDSLFALEQASWKLPNWVSYKPLSDGLSGKYFDFKIGYGLVLKGKIVGCDPGVLEAGILASAIGADNKPVFDNNVWSPVFKHFKEQLQAKK